MNADTDPAAAARRRPDLLAELSDGPLGLASHAAVPVVVDARLLHLLRVNFFLDDEPLDYVVEAELLLSPVFRDIGDGLFEIEPELRRFLLTSLRARYGMDRVLAVANLLWQYAEQTGTWRHRPELEKAQQLTALHLLDPEAAERWLAESESTAGTEHSLAPGWFAAMRYQFAHQPDLSRIPDVEAAVPRIDESKIAAMDGAQRRAVRDALLAVCPTRGRLAELLDTLDRPLADYVPELGTVAEAVFRVVRDAQAGGWLAQLLTEAFRAYPANRQLASVVSQFESTNLGADGAETLVHSLAEAEVLALAAVYSERISAGQLLRQAGLASARLPQGTSTAIEYWHAVNARLVQGVLPNARRRILTIAARDFPTNQAFETGLAAAFVRGLPWGAGQVPRADGELPMNGTVVAFDAVGYSDLEMLDQRQRRDGLRGIIEGALVEARIPPALLQQDRGDGYLMVFPADIPKARIVADFIRELGISLNEYNAIRNELGRIRLRVSIHDGDILAHGTSWAGDAVVTGVRLADAAPVRDALAHDQDADLALILSSEVFDSVVLPRLRGLSPGDFREVDATVKKFSAKAWLTLPGRPLPAVHAAPAGRPPGMAGTEPPSASPSTIAPDNRNTPSSPGDPDGLNAPVRSDGTKWDFFVSALNTDEAWGAWTAGFLQENGYLVRYDAWRPVGINDYWALDEGLRFSRRMIVVLSQAYLTSDMVQASWRTAFNRDRGGLDRRLIPVRVEECEPDGLLGGIRYIDLVPFKKDVEGARSYLAQQIDRSVKGGYRPSEPPPFPN
ncbi:Adenylate cyclase, class 3 [Parafrankia irregularis]|uniref:Adenylate cyclase, class 3 n=1 Tax=Parafrankia irregularis TaxID=795642 RepID=A0A0S4QQT1_9ACTN|nr:MULTISPECIES: effector-associated domain EAD1-containing protein [Parafrankia]MBE3201653.1 TIR domain-containing protein [Parafrankia sp. CH37]CUU57394.1 Adenylate cyclase, class 3 [Parafrankia irregularis]